MIRKTAKQHFFYETEKQPNFYKPVYCKKKKKLIVNNLTVMVTLIPLVEILGDSYKIPIHITLDYQEEF